MSESYVYGELCLRCECGTEETFEFHSLGWMFTIMEARDAGWRFDGVGKKAFCNKCGRKKFPDLYGKYPYHQVTNAGQRNPPRVVRRVRVEERKHDQEEVRSPRRVRKS